MTHTMVGFDGSHDSVGCVRWAAAQAKLQEAMLDIVQAYDYPAPERLDPATRQLLHGEAQTILDAGEAVAAEAASGLGVKAKIRTGNPATEVLTGKKVKPISWHRPKPNRQASTLVDLVLGRHYSSNRRRPYG